MYIGAFGTKRATSLKAGQLFYKIVVDGAVGSASIVATRRRQAHMPNWTDEEKKMALEGWVYYRHVIHNGRRATCRRLGNMHRDALIFDYPGYRGYIKADWK
jgi:hypothetical protein